MSLSCIISMTQEGTDRKLPISSNYMENSAFLLMASPMEFH